MLGLPENDDVGVTVETIDPRSVVGCGHVRPDLATEPEWEAREGLELLLSTELFTVVLFFSPGQVKRTSVKIMNGGLIN